MQPPKTQTFAKKVSHLGFTLVELIIVISILVILGTIAFTQFGSFQGSARDGDRVTTLKNIEKGLDVFQIKSGIYPMPEGEVSQGTINGSSEVYAYKGEIGDFVSRLIGINKTPTDPLSTSHYAYALSGDKKTYQVATVMENSVAYTNSVIANGAERSVAIHSDSASVDRHARTSLAMTNPFIPTAFAAQTSYQARVNGTYPGYIKFQSGAEVYIANIPSLIWSNSGETINLLSTGTYFVVNRQVNLPYKITTDTQIENQTADVLLRSITGQSNATLTGVNVTTVRTPEEIANTFTGQILASFAGVSGMDPNSPSNSHVIVMERVITGTNTTTGGAYIPVYLNCSETTQSWYTIPPLAHATQTTQTKSITNGTGSLTANCTDGQLAYNPESVSCTTPGFVEWPNLTCIADTCGSTITDANAHANQTSQTTSQSWHYDANPGICTYACNPNYTHNETSQLCEPNNCIAGTQTHNTHTYNVPELNHSITGSVISTPVAITNGTQTFTMVYECGFWTATGITSEVANTPICNTNFHYDSGTSSCVSDSQTHTCSAKPATGTVWNSVSSYGQTWNGASYIPANSTTSYNATGDTASCRYKCDTGYVWNATSYLCEVKLYVDDVFSAYTYTGNGGTQTITNGIDLAGNGGMVWLKGRSYAWGNQLVDTARGVSAGYLATHNTNAQLGSTYGVTTFNSNGYVLNSDVGANTLNNTYASWTFRKAPKFFDVVTYTGNGTNRTIAHNLGVTPGMVVVKRTDRAGDSWRVYHRSLPNTSMVSLNLTTAEDTGGSTAWNSTTATDSVFSLGTFDQVNGVGGTFVAYLFAHDSSADGIIQCGSTAGAKVTLGWEPQWIIHKSSNFVEDWNIIDTQRGMPFGAVAQKLVSNTSAAETTTSNSPKLYADGFELGAIAGTHIYCAIRRPNKPPTSGTEVFKPVLFTGTETMSLKTTNFPADLVFGRSFYGSYANQFVDRLRGGTMSLTTSSTNIETSASYLKFDTNNWVYAYTSAGLNKSGYSVIYEIFRRAPGVFDMVTYTGNGSARTINHNLGVAPELMIVKKRNVAGNNWAVGFGSFTSAMFMNTTDIPTVSNNYWNDTTPTTSVFSLKVNNDVNTASANYIAYLFATSPNISKVGSYTGNGGTQAINAGFDSTARFLLIKRTDVAGDWYVWDSTRGIVTGNDPHLSLNSTAAEVTTDDSVDPASTGFAVNQVTATNINVSGGTYIYLAIH